MSKPWPAAFAWNPPVQQHWHHLLEEELTVTLVEKPWRVHWMGPPALWSSSETHLIPFTSIAKILIAESQFLWRDIDFFSAQFLFSSYTEPVLFPTFSGEMKELSAWQRVFHCLQRRWAEGDAVKHNRNAQGMCQYCRATRAVLGQGFVRDLTENAAVTQNGQAGRDSEGTWSEENEFSCRLQTVERGSKV